MRTSLINRLAMTAALIFVASASMPYAGAQGKGLSSPGTPTRAIQDVDAILDDFIVKKKGEELTPDEKDFNQNLKQKIIHGTFDINELSRLSLAGHWTVLTKEQQDGFVGILTNLLEEKALFSKEQSAARSKSGGKYNVVYRGHQLSENGNRAFVRTRVNVPSENISINIGYKMKKNAGEWRVYDIIVDEASLVDNYKYQFNNIIKNHGYPDLVRRMKEKLDELKAKRKS